MPIVSEQTKIALETDDIYCRIQNVVDMYHDPEYRTTQLTYLLEAVQEQLEKAHRDVLAGRSANKSFKVNGVLFDIREDIKKAWGYAHNPAYRILKGRITELEKEMRTAHSKGGGAPETTAKYWPGKRYMKVHLLGNAHGEVPKEKYIRG